MTQSNLWELATTKLSEKDKAYVIAIQSFKIEDSLAAVDQRKQWCVDKQWTMKRHGKGVILRDVFTKIAVWISKFVAVGIVAVSFDQPHAALRWAFVRFLL